MAMKQTQTKLYDFSDVGLDFCAGSKSLFPDRFKKMLALGYNEQTVSSVSVSGNQVTLNYGVSHGYVADRVLKIKNSPLASINNGEFWIDSVTTNTVTMTIDDVPTNIEGNFKTVVAPLGWELVYELNHIHIYKFKHIDDTDMFLRICFQNNPSHRNSLVFAVGRTIDEAIGVINDQNTLGDTGWCESVIASSAEFKFDFGGVATSAHNNYTYAQGLDTYGSTVITGSMYHFIHMGHFAKLTSANFSGVHAVLPANFFINNNQFNYPVLIGAKNSTPDVNANDNFKSSARVYAGQVRLAFSYDSSQNQGLMRAPLAIQSYYSDSVEQFQTTSAAPIFLYEYSTRQLIGVLVGGMYTLSYASTSQPSTNSNKLHPSKIPSVDSGLHVLRHVMGGGNGSDNIFIAVPIEEIKID